jgi:D-arabinono-1,4-lactone oxidase
LESDTKGLFHPQNEDEIIKIVKYASKNKKQVRVRGSNHSYPPSIYTDNYLKNPFNDGEVNIILDRYTQVLEVDTEKREITAQAGIHLGLDPQDPLSKFSNSLAYTASIHGWALPMTGGITHQNLGGFMLTGSAGGSTHFSFHDAVQRIRIIDGMGTVQEFERDDQDENNKFWAVGISVGLLGIVSTVTLRLVPHFDIRGYEINEPFDACHIDLFGDGNKKTKTPSLEQHFKDNEFTRLMLWGQPGVHKVVTWCANKVKPEEYDTVLPDEISKEYLFPHGLQYKVLKRVPYTELPNVMEGLSKISQSIIKLLCRLFNKDPQFLSQYPIAALWDLLGSIPTSDIPTKLLAFIINTVFPNDTEETKRKFCDAWYRALPMDNEISDDIMPIQFSELWFPIEKTKEVMNLWLEHLNRFGIVASHGIFT